jgi:hypothetical protein
MKGVLLISGICISILSSCGKRGCTDPHALNYSEKATKDNGKCSYPAMVCVKSVKIEFDSIDPNTGLKWDEFDGPDVYCRINNGEYEQGQLKVFSTPVSSNITNNRYSYILQPDDYCITPPQIWDDGTWHFELLSFVFIDDDPSQQSSQTIGNYIFPITAFTDPFDEKSYPTIITEDQLFNNISNTNWSVEIELEWK